MKTHQLTYWLKFWRLGSVEIGAHVCFEWGLGAILIVDPEWCTWHVDLQIGPCELMIGTDI